MLSRLNFLLFGTLRRQLIVGVAAVHAVMMALFVGDLTLRQQSMLHERQIEQAMALAQSVGTSSAGWLAASDLSGLQEIVEAQLRYPELVFAMVLNKDGQVLAHTERGRLGRYVHDLPALAELRILKQTPALVDVVSPAVLAGRHIGWVRVGLGQQTASTRLSEITRDGVLYALAAILIGAFIAGMMGRRLTRRLHAIQAVVDAVQSGKPQQRVKVRGADEAALLAQEFNAMLDALALREHELLDSRDALRRSEERFDLAMRGANDGLWDWDLARNTVYYSPRWKEMIGYRPDEIGDSPEEWSSRLHPDDLPAATEAVQAHWRGETEFYQASFRFRHKEGRYLWILARAIALRGEDGKPVRMVGTHTDITDRKRLDEELRELNQSLKQRVDEEVAKNREKDLILIQQSRLAAMGEMVHNIAHQWRQPLNALSILISNIEDEYQYHELSAESLERSASQVHRLLDRMSSTIDDFRDFFRPDREATDFDIAGAVDEALSVLEASLNYSNIALTLELTRGLVAYGCANQFSQAVLNVLVNTKEAIQQRKIEQGRIRISLERSGDLALLNIQDNAGGVDEYVQPRLFDPYFTTKDQGSGIGLYMTKMILERNLHGTVSAANREGGLLVTIRLPLAEAKLES